MESFIDLVKERSYIHSTFKKNENASQTPVSTSYHRTISMDDLLPRPSKPKKNVVNSSGHQWASNWNIENIDSPGVITSPVKQNHITDTQTKIQRNYSNGSSTFNDLSKFTDPSDDVSPSTSTGRTRETTNNSLSFVKITTNATSKFEDLKSEAMDSWTEGVDLELDSKTKDSKAKKKAVWLSDGWFDESEPPQPPQQQEQNQPEWISEASFFQDDHVKQTYAEIVDNKTPAWAVHNDVQPNKTTIYPPQQIQMQPMMVMPPAFIPSPRDEELLFFLNFHLRSNSRQSFQALKKRMDTVLNHDIQNISYRTFRLLLKSLTLLLEYEYQHSDISTARKVHDIWPVFNTALGRFINLYTILPDDLLVILKFDIAMLRHFEELLYELHKHDITRVYEKCKDYMIADEHNKVVKLLKQLRMIQADDEKWSSHENVLPEIPTTEALITEVIQKVNVLEEYEAKSNLPVANTANQPWNDLDLARYLLVHYMLLRDEVVGPVQNVIKELFKGESLDEINVPECTVYEKTTPVSTSFMVSSSESCVVFKLGAPRANEQLMEDLQEGSFVVLLSENIKTQHSRLNSKKKIAELSMMGHVVRASSSYTASGEVIRLVSIHIQRNEVNKMNWGGYYTMISSRLNAVSTHSTLSWLHSQSADLDKKHFSWILTPRILGAKNILSQSQLSCIDSDYYEQVASTNDSAVPIYLHCEIDISPIMARNVHRTARPSEDVWPSLDHQWQGVSPSKRPPLYCISPSQLNAVKFALRHRVSVISGASGTGKTYLASKLTQLISEALRVGQFHQPVLVIAKTQSTLDEILSSMVKHVPDMIRFGCEPYLDSLVSKQATKLAKPSISDTNYRQYLNLEHRLMKNQSSLVALMRVRYQVQHHDPSLLSTTVPPDYLAALGRGYQSSRHEANASSLAIWRVWANDDDLTRAYSSDALDSQHHAQWMLENAYLKHCGHGLMPITDPQVIRDRFGWVANNPRSIAGISNASHWPFDNSRRSGSELRSSLFDIWKQHPADRVWHLSKSEKTALVGKIADLVVSFIDSEIEDVMQSQVTVAASFDEILIGKLTYLCRFNRVIGMTSDFAAAHRDWVSTLWPRAVIVDEASDMLESTLASSLVGPRTEHVILLGTSDAANKPRLMNASLNARHLDVSLFERWKSTANEFVLLEEQWHMHSQVADVVDKFNSIKLDTSSLLITAPMASCSENMVDKRNTNLEPLYGITQRAFYLHYQPSADFEHDVKYSKSLKTPLSYAEVDEARFVAFFAVYLSQQPYHTTSITILTLTLLQKYLIRAILRDEVPQRTVFKSQVSKIKLDVVEQYAGRHDDFVIVTTATPGYSSSSYDNLSRALTRARYGLFVVGKPGQDKVHERWTDFANYMMDRDLLGPAIQLTCHTHGDTIFAGMHTDFDKMKNGGCQRRCDTLMSDGHVCKEDCHFLSHEEIVCQEPCIRLRPLNCKHTCQKKCHECAKAGGCPPCLVETPVTLPCGHVYTDKCSKLLHLDQIKCKEMVDIQLPCGHVQLVECCKTLSQIVCRQEMSVVLPCGHKAIKQCGIVPICTDVCSQSLECGHKCLEICGADHSHERSQCTASCPKQLLCGHQCSKGCANPNEHTERCLERCNYICFHGYRCSRECYKDCIRCVSECPYKCEHYKCTKKCYEICDRPPCNSPCRKKLDCYHPCAGLCGEPCPPCKICNPSLTCSISLRTLAEFDPDEKVYMLPECGCVYSVESLDTYFENQAKNGEHTAIKLWDCPKCQQTIYTALRYNRYIKTELALVNEIKMRMEEERVRLSHHEIKQIVSAMNNETRNHAIHNIVGGRWFVCPNKHPYYVGDCGGASEFSKCPECDALIGGTEHRVVETNRFYGEFDGSEKPAWPGQPGMNDHQ